MYKFNQVFGTIGLILKIALTALALIISISAFLYVVAAVRHLVQMLF